MTEDEFSFHSNDKDIKGEKKNKLNIYQDKSKEDTKFIPSLEMPKEVKKRNFIPSLDMPKEVKKRNFIPTLGMSKEVKKRNFIPTLGMPKENERDFIPGYDSKNKIEPPKLKPRYSSNNKIEQPKFPLNYTPRSKIEKIQFKPNCKPINMIQKTKLPQNYISKNKITQPTLNIQKKLVKIIKGEKSYVENIKDQIKKFDWKKISDNWIINIHGHHGTYLFPNKECSKNNPLYKHKEWLKELCSNKTWKLNDEYIAEICGVTRSTIYRWRKKYNIYSKLKYQKLYNDGKSKECGRCHQIKNFSNYTARNMKNGKKTLYSRCNECRTEIKQIYHFKNKLKIIKNIYNGKLKGKCQKCNTDVKKLPSLEFHHTIPKLKKLKGINMHRNWENTKQQIENEKITILCVNCHTRQRSKYYNDHLRIIQENKLGPFASNKQISQYVKDRLSIANYEVHRQITRHIKKKNIIDYLYEGKCVGCGEITTKNNLPALHFHHIDKKNPYLMSKTYVNLRNLESKEIIKKLNQENCIPLCGNCHRMDQSLHFRNNYQQILSSKHWNQMEQYYNMIEKNILIYKLKEKKN